MNTDLWRVTRSLVYNVEIHTYRKRMFGISKPQKILLQSPYYTLCLYHFLFYPRYGQISTGLIILNLFWKKEIEIDLPLWVG